MRLKISLLVILMGLVQFGHAHADNAKNISYKGITLTPAIQNIELNQNQTTSTFKIKIENKQAAAISLVPSSLDFKSLNETGGVAFIGSNAANLQHKYGLANWISLPAGPLNLKPNTSREVSVTIDNRADLSPGGHYAAVLFKNPASSGGSGNKVSFNQVVATLVFIKKTGGEVYDLQLQPPKIKTAWFGLPSQVNLFIKNTGNTQTAPRGIVSIQNSAGVQFKKGIINTDSALVLPDSTRFYSVNPFTTKHAWLPGRYKAVITVRPDDTQTATTQEFNFFYVNMDSLLLFSVCLAAITFIVRYFRTLKKRIKRS